MLRAVAVKIGESVRSFGSAATLAYRRAPIIRSRVRECHNSWTRSRRTSVTSLTGRARGVIKAAIARPLRTEVGSGFIVKNKLNNFIFSLNFINFRTEKYEFLRELLRFLCFIYHVLGNIFYYQPGYYPEQFVALNAENQRKCVDAIYSNPKAFGMDESSSACLSVKPQKIADVTAVEQQHQKRDKSRSFVTGPTHYLQANSPVLGKLEGGCG